MAKKINAAIDKPIGINNFFVVNDMRFFIILYPFLPFILPSQASGTWWNVYQRFVMSATFSSVTTVLGSMMDGA